jgi:hypothetical protein
MKPLTERQKTLIVNNVIKSVKSGIDNLNNSGYNFLYLASGFIAHFNRYGFIAHYQQHSLKRDILDNERNNMWNNFHPSDKDYDYYMAKKDVYMRLVKALK